MALSLLYVFHYSFMIYICMHVSVYGQPELANELFQIQYHIKNKQTGSPTGNKNNSGHCNLQAVTAF